MLKRTLTGAVYVAIIVLFFLLRNYVDSRLFNILIFAFCAMGTFEVARALKRHLYRGNFYLAVIFGALFLPVYCLLKYLLLPSYAEIVVLSVSLLFIILQSVFAVADEKNYKKEQTENIKENKENKFKKFLANSLPFLYPSLFLLTTALSNGLESGYICLLLIFAISPCADTFAYLVGMTYNKIRKGKAKKMCPKLSPKKTWAGAIGGVIGGIIGAIVIYFIYKNAPELTSAKIPLIAVFIITGIFASVLTEIGDLFESYIKRKAGIKDMGKILPGHGGVMDRIDGMLFASVFIYLLFLAIL